MDSKGTPPKYTPYLQQIELTTPEKKLAAKNRADRSKRRLMKVEEISACSKASLKKSPTPPLSSNMIENYTPPPCPLVTTTSPDITIQTPLPSVLNKNNASTITERRLGNTIGRLRQKGVSPLFTLIMVTQFNVKIEVPLLKEPIKDILNFLVFN